MAHDVLVVDDESDIRALICGILNDEGYDTRGAGGSTEALAAIRARRPSLVILDIWLQGSELDGLEILKIIRRDTPDVPVLMISGHGTIETAVAAIKIGAYDFIEKPFKTDRLLVFVERAIEAARLKRENEELRLRAGGDEELIGGSSKMSQLRQKIDQVAPTGSRVLISGPAGSGKEVVARLVHKRSRRVEGPLVVVNSARLAPERFEIELFGAEAGAAGPDSPRTIGLFEQAHGGTLFFDEVADMPAETQGKIVRALQDSTFNRVGGGKVTVDVRVIASTSRELPLEIAAGRFREDLFYRLAVVPIAVPALVERREDIPLLANHLMQRAAAAARIAPRAFGDDALAALQGYEWPGNVRQLRNAIEWLLIMAPGEAHQPIRADMLPAEIAGTGTSGHGDRTAEMMSLPLRDAREMFERDYLLAQVGRFGGNISRTAAFIGMERSALHRKLKSLGLSEDKTPGVGEAVTPAPAEIQAEA
jgi:two-component system, NtrC family, nitrogen regulation response regulator NtrX